MKIKKTEFILIGIALMGLLLRLINIPGGSFLIVISLSSLSILYMFFSFAIFNGIDFSGITKSESYKGMKPIRIIGTVGLGFGISASIIGILYVIQYWSGAKLNIISGLVSTIIVLIVAFTRFLKNKDHFYKRIFLRGLLISIIALIFYFLPEHFIFKIQYSHYPNYVKAVIDANNDPQNQLLWDIVKEERMKMDYGDRYEEVKNRKK